MPTYRITTPDGASYNVTAPEGASQEQVLAYAKQHHGESAPVPNVPKPTGPQLQRGDSVSRGIRDAVEGPAQALTHILPDSIVNAGNRFNNWLADKGLPLGKIPEGGMDQFVKQGEQDYQNKRLASGESGFDGGRIVGNMLGTAPLAMMMPTAAPTLGGKVLQGAAAGGVFGATQPVTEGDFATEKAKQIGSGAVVGAIAAPIAAGISRIVKPQTSQQVQDLMKEGVTPTPGQILGGGFKKAEEAARSLPILGDSITNAQRKGVEQFNRAAINRALNPIGKSLDKSASVGYDAVDNAHQTISQAYDNLLPKLKVKADNTFLAEVNKLRGMASSMLPERAKQFNNIIDSSVIGKFTKGGTMHPQTMKEVDSQLGQMASKGLKSIDLDQQQLGAAIREVQSSLRSMVERANPQYAGELGKVNTAYANLLRVENAAAKVGAKEGVFSPSHLSGASRALDSSLRKSASARGNALMQDLAEAGDKVLANKLPDSGTPYRMAVGAGGLLSGMINPIIPAGLAGGSALYTQPAQKAIAALLTKRPEMAAPLAELIRKSSPALIPAGYGLLNTSN